MGLLHYHSAALFYMILSVRGSPNTLTIYPVNPLVKLGGNLTLTCVSSVPHSNPEWMALDNIAVIQRTSQESILNFASVNIAHEGKYTCSTKGKQKSTRIKVYDLPVAKLTTVPERPLAGQPFKVTCNVTNILDRHYIQFSIQLTSAFELNEKIPIQEHVGEFITYSKSYTAQIEASVADFQCSAHITVDSKTFQVRKNMTVNFLALSTTKTSVEPTSTQKTQEKMTTTAATTTAATTTVTEMATTAETTTTAATTETDIAATSTAATTTVTEIATTAETTTTAATTAAVRTTQKGQTKTMDAITSEASLTTSQKMATKTINPKNEISAVMTTGHPNAIPEYHPSQEKKSTVIHGFNAEDSVVRATEFPEKPVTSNVARTSERKALPSQDSEGMEQSGSSSTGTIAGCTLGSVATLSSLGFLTHLIRRMRRRSCAPDPLPPHAGLTLTA